MRNLNAVLFFGLVVCLLIGCREKTQPGTTSEKDTVKKNSDTTMRTMKSIVFFGNSMTAGYGLEPSEAFPAVIQHKIDSLGLPYKVINAGVSGETSSGGDSRIDWILRQPLDIFVLELGGNDGLRGIPLSETRKNIQSIIDKVKAKYPGAKIVLAGMQIPPNMGQLYTTEFRTMYPELSKKNGLDLIPFLLEGVGGEATLNQDDGIHPTAAGQRILAGNVWKVLQGIL